MRRFRRILVAVDLAGDHHLVAPDGLRQRCADALAKATWIAAESGAELRLVHVLPLSARARKLVDRDDSPSVVDAARNRLEGLVEQAQEHGVRAEAGLRMGQPAAEIQAEAERWRADLIVVAGHSTDKALSLLGSTAAQVFDAAEIPVWVSQRGMRRGIHDVLAAVELDEHSHGVLRLAADTARRLDAQLHALHVIPQEDEAVRQLRLDALHGWVRAHAAGVRIGSVQVRAGKPDDVLVEVAADIPAEAVFIGPTRRRPLLGWLGAHAASPLIERLQCSLVCARMVPGSPAWPLSRGEEISQPIA